MTSMIGKAVLLLNVLFLTFFIVHLSSIIYQILHPENPEVRIYKTNMKNLQFPVVIKICLKKNSNKDEEFFKEGFQNF